MKIEQIRPQYVCQVWPAVHAMLEKALYYSGGEYSIDQLKFMLVRGEQVLLVAATDEGVIGACSIAFNDYPNDRIAFITAIGGRLIACPELYGQLQDWCRINGATKIQGAARESVARLWKQKFCFEQRYIIVEQRL